MIFISDILYELVILFYLSDRYLILGLSLARDVGFQLLVLL